MKILILITLTFSPLITLAQDEDLTVKVETMIENGEDKQDIEDVLNDNGLDEPQDLGLDYEDDNT